MPYINVAGVVYEPWVLVADGSGPPDRQGMQTSTYHVALGDVGGVFDVVGEARVVYVTRYAHYVVVDGVRWSVCGTVNNAGMRMRLGLARHRTGGDAPGWGERGRVVGMGAIRGIVESARAASGGRMRVWTYQRTRKALGVVPTKACVPLVSAKPLQGTTPIGAEGWLRLAGGVREADGTRAAWLEGVDARG